MNQRILIAEDEPRLLTVLCDYFTGRGEFPVPAKNGLEALQLAEETNFDGVLLDIMMPELDGLSVCRALRKHSDVPIIFLTALSDEEDKLLGYELGADDYVTKPFSPAELTARIDALYRRIGGDNAASSELLTQGPFVMNIRNHTLEKSGNRVRLTQVEYAIMKLFMQNPGRALSREDILAAVWGSDYEGELKIVDVNIRRLRIKIEDDTANPTYITTVWGYGYKWGA